MHYVKIKITKKGITIIDHYDRESAVESRKNKSSDELIVKYNSREDAENQIRNHNNIINNKVSEKSQSKSKIISNHKAPGIKLWPLEKIPQKVWDQVIDLVKGEQWSKIFQLHKTSKWTDENYCCDGYKKNVIYNVFQAATKKIINSDKTLESLFNNYGYELEL